MVTPGELVVLTNKRTGADVICRVTSVKTQPGIQNYVHLEFTPRALDFWEETPASDRGNSAGKAAVFAAPLTVTPAVPMPPASGSSHSGSTTDETELAEKSPAPAPRPNVTTVADTPAA